MINYIKNKLDKIKYEFENLVLRKTWVLIFLLFSISILIVFAVSSVINLDDSEKISSIASLINAWFPEEYEIGSERLFVSKVISAFIGLFLTSVLIGTITEKIGMLFNQIRKANSKVVEENHIVILGYDFENHRLIKELIYSFDKRKTILLVDNKDVEEIEENLYTNIDIPRNVRIVIRSIKPWDYNELKKCSIEKSEVVIVTPLNDIDTIKTIFAINKILKNDNNKTTHIVSAINDNGLYLNFSDKNNVMIKTNDLLSKIITMSNKQTRLAKVIQSLFSFKEAEFYLKEDSSLIGKNFIWILNNMVDSVPLGIYRNNDFILFPEPLEKLELSDKILYYSFDGKYKMSSNEIEYQEDSIKCHINDNKDEHVLIMGYNHKLNTIIENFGDSVKKIVFACESEEQIAFIKNINLENNQKFEFILINKNNSYYDLYNLLKDFDYMILLSDERLERETSDINNMHWYIKMIKIREDFNLKFSVLVELYIDENRKLLEQKYSNDFIVSTNIISIFLAQMAQEPKLKPFFVKLLSSKKYGIELHTAKELGMNKSISIGDLRLSLYNVGYILLGYIKNETEEYIYCPTTDSNVNLEDDDALILLSNFNS